MVYTPVLRKRKILRQAMPPAYINEELSEKIAVNEFFTRKDDLMSPTPREYNKMSEKAAPNSKLWKNVGMAFLVGGLICTIGQGILSWTQWLGLSQEEGGAVTSIALIFLSALLTGLNRYDDLAKHAGAGTLVPITGFANSMVSPALEFKREGLILGVGAKMFSIAGPVILYGISASVLYGLIIALFH